MLHRVEESLRPLSHSRKVSLRIGGDVATIVEGDEDQLEQTFTHVIENAVKFTPVAGCVDVEVMAARRLNGSPSVTIDITDTGMGIPADDIPHVFERFFRATNAQVQAVQGTGLGLAIVREIVRAHRGDVSVSSVLGEGTALRIELPARQSAPVQDRSKVPSMPSRENYPDQLYSRGDGGI